MLGLGFLGFRMLVIVLEFIVPDEFLPCINKWINKMNRLRWYNASTRMTICACTLVGKTILIKRPEKK